MSLQLSLYFQKAMCLVLSARLKIGQSLDRLVFN
jgi:hypothetical protein